LGREYPSRRKQVAIVAALTEGVSIRAVEHLTGLHCHHAPRVRIGEAVANWLVEHGFLGRERENLFVEPGAEARPSPAFRRVVHRGQLRAQERGHATATGADILLELFPEKRNPAAHLLDKHGVSQAQAADVQL
jgi:ATP-dependent Clp protease ATP-binding subunit ClpA